jgi:hypothetical protein
MRQEAVQLVSGAYTERSDCLSQLVSCWPPFRQSTQERVYFPQNSGEKSAVINGSSARAAEHSSQRYSTSACSARATGTLSGMKYGVSCESGYGIAFTATVRLIPIYETETQN